MKCIVNTACVLSVLVAVSYAAPYFPTQFSASSNLQIGGGSPPTASTGGSTPAAAGGGLAGALSNIDLPGLLRGVNSFVKIVGVFCPPLSQVLDNVIQNVTSTAFRVFGRAILRNGLGGGSGGSGGGSQRVNVVLPTFPPDEDDYDDEDDETTSASPGSDDGVDLRIAPSTTSTTTQASETVSPTSEDNTISKRHVRVVREAGDEDQDGAESAPQPAEDLSNVEVDDADRNKRFLPFGGSVSGHAAAGGGSGNFLFDIIRNTADRAARTVGTVYRMVAGTENLGWGLTATSETSSQTITPSGTATAPAAKLVAGSGATEESDEKANSPGGVVEVDVAKSAGADGYTEGIPGPITRLFVIANRGIANLVQDLILRLAQTSERLVNFKARLVTSLI